jgi:iron uptake system EfeUOB component EfeO/EfeM
VKDAIKDLNSDANELIKDAEKLEQQIKELEK